MRRYLHLIDIHTLGPRYDVTPLFADPLAFAELLDDFQAYVSGVQLDVVVGIDALGFILGTGLAVCLAKGFVPIRKGGKLPVLADSIGLVDYSKQLKVLELRRGAIRPGMRVLVVDEWIETGAQVLGAIRLVERQGGVVIGIAAIHMDVNEQTQRLAQRYPCYTVWPNAP